MHPAIQIIRRRRQARPSRLARLGLNAAGLIALLLAVLALWAAFGYSQLTADLPPLTRLAELLDPPQGQLLLPTTLYDRSGQHALLTLANPDSPRSQPWPAWYAWYTPPADQPEALRLPSNVISATLAAADPGFWQQEGGSLAGLWTGEAGSLAQQLTGSYLLADEPPSLRRALRQRILAVQATRAYGHEKLMEWYLNHADYGRLAFGIEAAAQVYFDKPAADLSLGEAALLAAVAQNPALNPIEAPSLALERQKFVLQSMLQRRMADPMAIAAAASQTLEFRAVDRPGQALSISALVLTRPSSDSLYLQIALQQAESAYSFTRLARGGLRIITSLDYELQRQAGCAIEAQSARLNGQTPTSAAGCEAQRLLPALPAVEAGQTRLSFDFESQVQELVALDPVNGQILALIGPSNGVLNQPDLPQHAPGTVLSPLIYLTAFTRGYSPATLLWDIPPGENRGQTSLSGEAAAGEAPAPAASPTPAPPQPPPPLPNLNRAYSGPLRLRNALANDAVAPANNVLLQVGIENVWRTAAQFGLPRPQPDQPLQPGMLGSTNLFRPMSLLEIGQVYSVLANRGLLAGSANAAGPQASRAIQPLAVLSVLDGRGEHLQDLSAPATRPIIPPDLAYLVNHILSDEAARWPSLGHPNATETGRPAAVKIGRTADDSGHWIIGYTPERVLGVWLGRREPGTRTPEALPVSSQEGEHLRAAGAGVWHALMQYSAPSLSSQTWERPANVSQIKVCDPSGMLPTRLCPNVVEEVFAQGSEPIQVDRMYRSLAINRESGRLATVFTPPDVIEEQTYFLPVAGPAGWQGPGDRSRPPEVYDTIPAILPRTPGAEISAPAMFAVVRGKVSISGIAGALSSSPQVTETLSSTLTGTLTGTLTSPITATLGSQVTPAAPTPGAQTAAPAAAFDFYRVQVGAGLNPQQWLLVGKDQTRPQPDGPLADGPLAVWDTQGLSGVYAVQLLVGWDDRSVQRSTVLVTVDNQPPQVHILLPELGEQISAAERPSLVLLAEALDDLAIRQVAFYLDGKRLADFSQPPYAISWPTLPGMHTLRVVATDSAGNTSETELVFEVK